MIPIEKNSRAHSKITNLDEVRQARARAAEEKSASTTARNEGSEDRHGNRRFDAEKVARIKAAIAAGEYQIDPSRIADKFIEHDRNQ